jgi:hypothetical protein
MAVVRLPQSDGHRVPRLRGLVSRDGQGLVPVGRFGDHIGPGPMRREVTKYARPGNQLHFAEDLLSDVRYVRITGADPSVVRVTTEITEAGPNLQSAFSAPRPLRLTPISSTLER